MPFAGELSALFTALMWTVSSLVFAEATIRVGSVYVNVTRLLFAALALCLIVVVFGIPLSISLDQLGWLALSGIIGLVFGDTFLFKSYEHIGPRLAMLVMSTAPALTALIAYLLLDERLTVTAIAGMGVTLSGITIVVMERKESGHPHSKHPIRGVLFAGLGALGQAGGLIAAKLAFNEAYINGFAATLIRITAASLVIVPLMYAAGRYRHPIAVFQKNKSGFKYTMAGTLFGPVLGIAFSLISILYTNVAVAATLMATVPIMMLPAVRIVYKEKLSWRATVGALIAVMGVAILFMR